MNSQIPPRFPACFSDWINDFQPISYIPQIHAIVDFSSEPDRARMEKAFGLLLDAEPILGCRLRRHWFRPHWERLPPERLGGKDLFFIQRPEREEALEKAVQAFFGEPMDPARGPQVRAVLFVLPKGRSRLVIKVCHLVSDAAGVKEVLYRLAETYRGLGVDPGYRPRPRLGSRSLWQIYGKVPLFSWPGLLHLMLRELVANSVPARSLRFPSGDLRQGPLSFVFKRFPAGRVERIALYAKRYGATLNDVFEAALLRAVARQNGHDPKDTPRLAATVDFRRNLPGHAAGGLANLSGIFVLNLPGAMDQSFDATLVRVKTIMDSMKSGSLGMGSMLLFRILLLPFPVFLGKKLMEAAFKVSLKTGNLPVVFTNMGAVEGAGCDFGRPQAEAVELAVPGGVPPFFITGLSGFKGALSLSAGFWPSAVPEQKVREFFDLVDQEIP